MSVRNYRGLLFYCHLQLGGIIVRNALQSSDLINGTYNFTLAATSTESDHEKSSNSFLSKLRYSEENATDITKNKLKTIPLNDFLISE